MEMDPLEASHWKYRGEGAANVVLFYDGKNPELMGKVLRIRKLFHSPSSPNATMAPSFSEKNVIKAAIPETMAIPIDESNKPKEIQKLESSFTESIESKQSNESEPIPPVAGLETEDSEDAISVHDAITVEINTDTVEAIRFPSTSLDAIDSINNAFKESNSTKHSNDGDDNAPLRSDSANNPDHPFSSHQSVDPSKQIPTTNASSADGTGTPASMLVQSKSSFKYQRSDSVDTRHPVLSFEEQILWADWPEISQAKSSADLMFYYAELIIKPLFGADHVDPGKIVHISQHFFEIFSKDIDEKRPSFRKENKNFEIAKGKALLISDHSFMPTLDDAFRGSTVCVEIKPKCGYIPQCPSISPKNKIKTKKSRFSLLQYLKLVKGQVNEISHYNPLFLFSDIIEEVVLSIFGLFLSPQNNFRLFLDGIEILGQKIDQHVKKVDEKVKEIVKKVKLDQRNDEKLTSKIHSLGQSKRNEFFDELLAKIGEKLGKEKMHELEKKLSHFFDGFSVDNKNAVRLFIELVAKIICESKIMQNLLRIQKLDCFDIEGMVHVYESFKKNLKKQEELESQLPNLGRNNSMEKNVKEIFAWKDTENFSFKRKTNQGFSKNLAGGGESLEEEERWRTEIEKIKKLSAEECKRVLKNFLISTTAKDLGMMVSIKKVSNHADDKTVENFIKSFPEIKICEFYSQWFVYKISFVDLDMKPLKKIPKYFRFDQEILENFFKLNDDGDDEST